MLRPGSTRLLFLLLATLPACGREEAEPAPDGALLDTRGVVSDTAPERVDVPDGAPLVAFLGDSISAGLHLPADRAFPAVLQRLLVAEGAPFRLVNAGVSGDTSAGGLARLDWILKQEPEVLVVELGGNDGLRGVSLDSVETNLRAILERARAAGAEPLLLGMRIPTNYAEYGDDFAEIYPRLAKELDVAFVPYFMEGVGGVPELNLPDGLHPSEEGHEQLAEKVIAGLRALIREE